MYLQNNTCHDVTTLITSCLYYSDYQTCIHCTDGFVLVNNECIQTTLQNCVDYYDEFNCSKCEEEYGVFLIDSVYTCSSILTNNCLEYDYDSPNYPCSKCDIEYYLNDGNCSYVNSINGCEYYESVSLCQKCSS